MDDAYDTVAGFVKNGDAPAVTKDLDQLADDVSDWVRQGGGAKPIRNAEGDFIFIDDTNSRRFRLDINDPSPHQHPHMHLEWKDDQGKWIKPGPIYPKDVDPS